MRILLIQLRLAVAFIDWQMCAKPAQNFLLTSSLRFVPSLLSDLTLWEGDKHAVSAPLSFPTFAGLSTRKRERGGGWKGRQPLLYGWCFYLMFAKFALTRITLMDVHLVPMVPRSS